jgi:translocation and assembly module TamB
MLNSLRKTTKNGGTPQASSKPWSIDIGIKGNHFLAFNTPEIYILISPDIHFSAQPSLTKIKGEVLIPEANIAPSSLPEGSVSISPDTEIIGQQASNNSNMEIDLRVQLADKVQLNAFGLKSKIKGALTVKQLPQHIMTAQGSLHLDDGTFRAYGQDLSIDNGSIFYTGGNINNPGLQLSASRQISQTQVGINVTGTANKPKISTFSDNTRLESKDIVSMILTGQRIDNLDKAKIYAGKEITKDLSVGVNAGIGDDGSEFITRYRLTDDIHLEGTSGTSKSSANIIHTFEIE